MAQYFLLSAAARRTWCDRRRPFMRRQPVRVVFIDETSVKTNMTPSHGPSHGERLSFTIKVHDRENG